MERLPIPNKSTYLYPYDVILIGCPQSKYVVMHGWFEYAGLRQFGWYLEHPGSHHIVLPTDSVLSEAVKIGTTMEPKFIDDNMSIVDRLIMSDVVSVVLTIADRDALSDTYKLPDNKVVFVVENGITYTWCKDSLEWKITEGVNLWHQLP